MGEVAGGAEQDERRRVRDALEAQALAERVRGGPARGRLAPGLRGEAQVAHRARGVLLRRGGGVGIAVRRCGRAARGCRRGEASRRHGPPRLRQLPVPGPLDVRDRGRRLAAGLAVVHHDDADPSGGRLGCHAERLVAHADGDARTRSSRGASGCRRRRCRPRCVRADPGRRRRRASASLSARCPYRSQPACAVQSRSELVQRSARSRTPGTPATPARRRTRPPATYTSISASHASSVGLGHDGRIGDLAGQEPGSRSCRSPTGRRPAPGRASPPSRALSSTANDTPYSGSRAPWRR